MKKIYLQTALPSILYQNYIPCGRQYNTSTGTYDFYRYFFLQQMHWLNDGKVSEINDKRRTAGLLDY